MRLKDKVAIVTGSSRGIGRAIALRFAEEGCNVVVNYHANEEAAAEVVALANRSTRRAVAIRADVSSRDDVQGLLAEAIWTFGRVDVLVNNAGFLQQKPFDDITDAEWDRMLAVCLKAPFICTQEVLRHLRPQRSGRIINIASMGGQFGGPKAPHYAAAKAGLICFTKSTARLAAPYSVTANCISPGFVRTDMSEREIGELGGPDAAGKTVPVGRVGEPADIASTAVFLASDESGYITGQTIAVNGGLYML